MYQPAIIVLLILFVLSIPVFGEEPPVGQKGVLSVTDFGAKGDGETDDTEAIQKALDACAEQGGGIVFVPTGNYLIKTRLNIPAHVTLEGVFRAPTARSQYKGSTLLAVADKGNADGDPFIALNPNSTLKGLTVYYPEQDKEQPVPYPWAIRGAGDNCSVIDVLLVNPWMAVDFGSHPCGRHMIRNLYAQALHKGIFVDKCYDVGRIENVHLWPFWEASKEMEQFMSSQATAFIFGRTDWEFVTGLFCIWYKTGFHFTQFADGPGNVIVTNSGSDIGPIAMLVEGSQGHSGHVFTNCQFMAGIEIKESNAGPIKFHNCGFWGIPTTTYHANIKGNGHVSFNGCHFISWDAANAGVPAIIAEGNGLTVTGCDFMEAKNHIELGPNSKASVIMGNRFRGGMKIENKSAGKVEMGLNVDE